MTKLYRRLLIPLLAAAVSSARAEEPTAWDFSFPDIDGGTLELAKFRGKVLLVVNTASFCGFTYQYEALEKLSKEERQAGLVIIGVPSGDFKQESDTNAKVKSFCQATYGVDFPMTAISKVVGDEAAPFYRWVKRERNWEPSWNFNKVIIGRNGRIIACFGSSDEPNGMRVRTALSSALAAAA